MNKRRIVLAGGSGFLGALLAGRFVARKDEVIVLTRSPRGRTDGVKEVCWDGKILGDWAYELEGAFAVINLAGRSVNCRYHSRNRRAIMDSRVDSTRVLGEAIAHCVSAPRVWLNSSTGTIYGHSFDQPMDEAGEIRATREARDELSIAVANAWEAAFTEAHVPRTRKVTLRLAMVLGAGGNSVLPAFRNLARFGLGGKMGSGKQFASWIHEEDYFRAINWLAENETFEGVVNVAAPNPLPNAEVMRIFREVCGLPFGLRATGWMLETGAFFLRTETELIIKSRRVVPKRLEAAGFNFRFRDLEQAVREIEGRVRNHNG
jgi:uncharacterized protein